MSNGFFCCLILPLICTVASPAAVAAPQSSADAGEEPAEPAAATPVFIEEQEAARRALIPRAHLLIGYLILIMVKVYIASFRIAWKVVSGDITPRIVHFRTHLRSDLARVALANSITLTPGTLTLDLDEDHLVVHWLDAPTTHSGYAAGLIARPFERWLKRIWV